MASQGAPNHPLSLGEQYIQGLLYGGRRIQLPTMPLQAIEHAMSDLFSERPVNGWLRYNSCNLIETIVVDNASRLKDTTRLGDEDEPHHIFRSRRDESAWPDYRTKIGPALLNILRDRSLKNWMDDASIVAGIRLALTRAPRMQVLAADDVWRVSHIADRCLISPTTIEDISNFDPKAVFVPIHVSGNHWILMVIDRPCRTAYFFDTDPRVVHKTEIGDYLKKLIPTLIENNIVSLQNAWAVSVGIQDDGWSCGFWVVNIARMMVQAPQEFAEQLRKQRTRLQYSSADEVCAMVGMGIGIKLYITASAPDTSSPRLTTLPGLNDQQSLRLQQPFRELSIEDRQQFGQWRSLSTATHAGGFRPTDGRHTPSGARDVNMTVPDEFAHEVDDLVDPLPTMEELAMQSPLSHRIPRRVHKEEFRRQNEKPFSLMGGPVRDGPEFADPFNPHNLQKPKHKKSDIVSYRYDQPTNYADVLDLNDELARIGGDRFRQWSTDPSILPYRTRAMTVGELVSTPMPTFPRGWKGWADFRLRCQAADVSQQSLAPVQAVPRTPADYTLRSVPRITYDEGHRAPKAPSRKPRRQ